MSRLYNVTQLEVAQAWKAVRQAGGGRGCDQVSLQDIEADKDNYLYKIWNRLLSGSYIPKPVLLVNIPKAKGGTRQLGVPTVSDRIAQMVIKKRLEEILEPSFHKDSYAYRPDRSAIDAVTVCRQRCFKYEWLVEIDIQSFFDDLDHKLLQTMVQKYTGDKTILVYVGKFLTAMGVTGSGEEVKRYRGTPQGGVVSPLLANLYLHESFDKWMGAQFANMPFERYADDIVVHCVSEKQAHFIKDQIKGRLAQFGLTLHPEKTRIVYTGTQQGHNDRGHALSRKMTFLGYDFKPRVARGRLVFTPGIGQGAIKIIRHKIKTQWQLKHRVGESLKDIARGVNPVIRGWINYYGHHRRSDLYALAYVINGYLVQFIRKKHKAYNTWDKAWKELLRQKAESKFLFCHWHMISLSN